MVEAQALIHLDRMEKVVPPCEFFCVVIDLPKKVDKSPLFQVLERIAFRFGKVKLISPN